MTDEDGKPNFFHFIKSPIKKNLSILLLLGNDQVTQVLDVDPAQLAQLLAQSADGTAQLIDEHGNAITVNFLFSFH